MSRSDDIENQAALWIARVDRGGEDRARLAAWLAADPRHRAAYLRLAEAWRRSQGLERLRPADGEIDPDLLASRDRRTGRMRRNRRIRTGDDHSGSRQRARALRTLGWATAAACIAVATVIFWMMAAMPAARIYHTGPGGLWRGTLADGTSLILNANTEVQVRYTERRRVVTLEHGEAQFLVIHDAHRPFFVHAGGHIVRDVGTHFDVRLDADDSVEVLVTQGRVALLQSDETDSGASVERRPTVAAGQLALVEAKWVTVRRLTPREIASRLAWKDRELHFRGETLARAIAQFDRHNSPRIIIADPGIAALRIGGSFNAIDTASFVAALNRTFGISARQSDDAIYLSGPVRPRRP